jgi:hypothetical protein
MSAAGVSVNALASCVLPSSGSANFLNPASAAIAHQALIAIGRADSATSERGLPYRRPVDTRWSVYRRQMRVDLFLKLAELADATSVLNRPVYCFEGSRQGW